jgi:predicted outer membrane protein
LLVFLLSACGALRGNEATEDPAAVADLRSDQRVDTGDPGAALTYYAKVRRLSGVELQREQEAARRALMRSRSDGNRMRYALALTVPGAPAADDTRALETLEPLTRNAASPLLGLALLMTGLLQEQRRLDSQAQTLQQKLDAMLELERSMTGRDGGVQRKR